MKLLRVRLLFLPITVVASLLSDRAAAQLPCGKGSTASIMACVDTDRYMADVRFIGQPRVPASQAGPDDDEAVRHHAAVQSRCADVFREAGFQVHLHSYDTGTNVIGTLPGTTRPKEVILFGAHYDSTAHDIAAHIGSDKNPQGLRLCPGANDNGSGVAGVLEVARILGHHGPFSRTVVVACWDEEEFGNDEGWLSIGSREYVKQLKTQTNPPTILQGFNFEMIGYKDDRPFTQDIPLLLGIIYPEQLLKLYVEYSARANFVLLQHDDLSYDGSENALVSPPEPHMGRMLELAHELDVPTLRIPVPVRLLNFLRLVRMDFLSTFFAPLMRSDHRTFWNAGIPMITLNDTGEFRNPTYHCLNGIDDHTTVNSSFAIKNVKLALGVGSELLR